MKKTYSLLFYCLFLTTSVHSMDLELAKLIEKTPQDIKEHIIFSIA